jgi:hypothetical protein
MTGAGDLNPWTLDRIRHDLVGLKMPRSLEALDHIIRRLEQSEIGALEAIYILLAEELTPRENSRITASHRSSQMRCVSALKWDPLQERP